ncbi:PRC-barrel domain containing protein [Billgrantia kenyensis]|uniref:PRC-barrel domain containing protein n=1 Tax=Billgrantia kenyensis TaxID=321266 RepID=A0A7W0AF13_9GAMM|nr:PRC-barrel domain containing protein [Halomonas kenyensis]MBA2779891.1 PRC-barrel domain containing protein [Halomonas kenyensis]MCG6662025.1 PRC-barrel domain containing protein [Halomonas kenyensis]
MTQPRITRTTLAAATGLFVAGLASGVQAQFEPQGLYSTRALFDAEVHFEAAPDTQPGEVVDILLGDDRQVHAIVVQPDDNMGLEGDYLVITNANYRLVNYEDDGDTVHDIIVDADPEALEAMPRYDQEWWDMARERTREAWHSAGEGADSAWQQTRRGADRVGEGAEQAWERTQEGAERAGRTISETLDRWSGN